jgi:predicted RNA-binding Zn-ribbon protein involved in translation (DUF1610 family)
MRMQTMEARALPCRGCGAPLAIDPTVAEARCPACGATTQVPNLLRERAQDYSRNLEQERGRIRQARSGVGMDRIGLLLGIPLGIVIGGHVVATMVIDEEYRDVELYAFYGGIGLVLLIFFVGLAISITRQERAASKPAPPVVVEAFVGTVPSPCSQCGGQVQFTVEQQSARCPYCGNTVYPTRAVQQSLLGIAAERADLEVARANRRTARDLAISFDAGVVSEAMSLLRWLGFLMMPAIFVFVGVGLLTAFGLPDVTRLDSADPGSLIAAGFVTVGGLIGAIVVLAFVLIRVLSRAAVIKRTMRHVAAAFGGRAARGVRAAFDWLDAHWAADVTGDTFSVEASGGGTRIVRWSTPVTFANRPGFVVAAHAPHFKRVDLFFAQHRRRVTGDGLGTPAAHELRSAGWVVVTSNGGVQLTRLDSDPRGFAVPIVGWALERAAAVAAA